MTISAELIAICILGVSLVSLGWKVTGDLRQEIHQVTEDLRQEIHLVRQDVTVLGDRIGRLEQRVGGLEQRMGRLEQRVGGLEQRVGGLEQRVGNLERGMARLEGWIEGRFVKQPELKAKPATSR